MDSGPYNLLIKQLSALFVGLVAAAIVMAYDYRLLAGYSKYLYGITLALIVIVLILGTMAGGAKRWLTLAGFAFQP